MIEIDYIIATPAELDRMKRESEPRKKFGGFRCKNPQTKLSEVL